MSPPLSAQIEKPVRTASPPVSTGKAKTSQTSAITRNATSAATLMRANQNSSSPNTLTATMLAASTTTSAMSARSHCGAAVNAFQYCRYSATAVVSTIEVIAQFRKYIQPAA